MARHLTKEERIKYMRYDNAISMRPALECSYNYCKVYVEGEMEIEAMGEQMKHSKEYVDGYRDGFYNGADCKQNFKLNMLGYEVGELLKIINEHELKIEKEVGLPIDFSFPMSKRNEWTECANELRKQGFKITK